jgi:hypothetical protein
MTVAFDEARHREGGLQLDDLGRRSDKRRDISGRSKRDNPAGARRERFRFRHVVVEGDDASAAKDEVGRRRAMRARGRSA